jgi:hypothetical protein
MITSRVINSEYSSGIALGFMRTRELVQLFWHRNSVPGFSFAVSCTAESPIELNIKLLRFCLHLALFARYAE